MWGASWLRWVGWALAALSVGLPAVGIVRLYRSRSVDAARQRSRILTLVSGAALTLFTVGVVLPYRWADFTSLCVVAGVWAVEIIALGELQRLRTQQLLGSTEVARSGAPDALTASGAPRAMRRWLVAVLIMLVVPVVELSVLLFDWFLFLPLYELLPTGAFATAVWHLWPRVVGLFGPGESQSALRFIAASYLPLAVPLLLGLLLLAGAARRMTAAASPAARAQPNGTLRTSGRLLWVGAVAAGVVTVLAIAMNLETGYFYTPIPLALPLFVLVLLGELRGVSGLWRAPAGSSGTVDPYLRRVLIPLIVVMAAQIILVMAWAPFAVFD